MKKLRKVSCTAKGRGEGWSSVMVAFRSAGTHSQLHENKQKFPGDPAHPSFLLIVNVFDFIWSILSFSHS